MVSTRVPTNGYRIPRTTCPVDGGRQTSTSSSRPSRTSSPSGWRGPKSSYRRQCGKGVGSAREVAVAVEVSPQKNESFLSGAHGVFTLPANIGNTFEGTAFLFLAPGAFVQAHLLGDPGNDAQRGGFLRAVERDPGEGRWVSGTVRRGEFDGCDELHKNAASCSKAFFFPLGRFRKLFSCRLQQGAFSELRKRAGLFSGQS